MINITKPTLLLNEDISRANIAQMAAKARSNNLLFRPHFKTHQSRAVGEWLRQEGVSAITVSSLGMAAYFAEAGWDDITVAFPCNVLEMPTINVLAQKLNLSVLVDHRETVQKLDAQLQHSVSVYIEVDTGKHRTGIWWEKKAEIEQLWAMIETSQQLNFKGLYIHAGHSYSCQSREEIATVHGHTMSAIRQLRDTIPSDIEVCYGDTPTCSVMDNFETVEGFSPGNFVFYDLMQTHIGSCVREQIALAVACPVVSVGAHPLSLCIYGGAIHFSKETVSLNGGAPIFGEVVKLERGGWSAPIGQLVSLSQEHGLVSLYEAQPFSPGDVVGVLPVHACLTAQAMGGYTLLDGRSVDHYAQKSRA